MQQKAILLTVKNVNTASSKFLFLQCYNPIMPTICEFDGMKIQMFYQEHHPAHFHVVYSGRSIVVGIDPILILKGELPAIYRSRLFEWAAIHQAELRANWELARGHRALIEIKPLD